MTIELLLSTGRSVWELLGQAILGYERERNLLFAKHIEPLQARMLTVHEDYMSGIQQVYEFTSSEETTSAQIIDFMEKRRRAFAAERDLALRLAVALSKAERRLVRSSAWSALMDYCAAIDTYLTRPYLIYGRSAYRGLIEVAIDSRLHHPGIPMSTFSTLDPRRSTSLEKDVLRLIARELLENHLPHLIGQVNEAYARLQVQLK